MLLAILFVCRVAFLWVRVEVLYINLTGIRNLLGLNNCFSIFYKKNYFLQITCACVSSPAL